MKPSRRSALLRLGARAYPRSVRERDGEVLVQLAEELVEAGSSPFREAAGLVRAGTSARLGAELGAIAQAPWREARARLALPLAAALFALAATGAARAGLMGPWIGWSVVVTLTGASIALVGAAMGGRWLAASGATLVTAMLALDAFRDAYGSGARWHSEVGSALIDVLVMWIPAGLLAVACAGAVSRVPAQAAARRLAWGLVPGAILFIVASRPAGVMAADRVVLFGGFVVAAALAAVALIRQRSDPAIPLVAALVLAVVTAPAVWMAAIVVPLPDSQAPWFILGYYGLAGLVAGAAVLSLVRLGAATGR
jgi:hypothetical protein